MIKTLRFKLVALLALVANISFAQTTIDFTQQTITVNDKVGYTLTVSGYTFKAEKAEGSTVPTQNAKSKDLRHYAKNTLTVSGADLKVLVFNMSEQGLAQWGNVTASVGTVTIDKENGKTNWTNPDGCTSVTFTIGTDNTYGTNTSKTAGQFDVSSVVINGEAGGGDQPETPAVPTADNIAAFKALTNGTTAVLKLNNAVVVYKNVYTTKSGTTNTEYYVRDATGAVQFYNTDLTLEVGNALNGTVEGKLSVYNGMPELTKTANTSAANYTVEETTAVSPTEVKVADLQDDAHIADLVIVKGTFSTVTEGSYTNTYLTDGDSKVMVYDKFKAGVTIPTDNVEYAVKGIFVSAKLSGSIVYELAPLSVIPASASINTVEAAAADANAPVYNIAGQRVSKDYKGLVIVNGKKMMK